MMPKKTTLPITAEQVQPAIFEDTAVRQCQHNGEWYCSVVDAIAVLSGSKRPRKYWTDLKAKLEAEGFQLSAKIGQLNPEGAQLSAEIGQLKMLSPDGKFRMTDAALPLDSADYALTPRWHRSMPVATSR
jgi:hypothetical protein